jgi:DNA-directed RNA polymerase specialized sigma24 family protein
MTTATTETSNELVKQLYRRAQGIASRLCQKSHACYDDLLQEMVLRALRNAHRYEPARGTQDAFFHMIMWSAGLDTMKKWQRQRRGWSSKPLDDARYVHPAPHDPHVYIDLKRVHRALMEHPSRRAVEALGLKMSGAKSAEIDRVAGKGSAKRVQRLQRSLRFLSGYRGKPRRAA